MRSDHGPGATATSSGHPDDDLRASIAETLSRLWSSPVAVRDLRPFGDGHSGFTYLVTLAGERWPGEYVARLSPPGTRIAGPADVGRQGRLMAALHRQGLPVPRVIAADSSGLTGGRALAVMERVDGVGWQAATAELGDHQVSVLAIDFLRRLGRIEPGVLDMDGEPLVSPRADLDRWHGLLRYCPAWLADPCEQLHARLAASPPDPGPARLVHGDFHYGNMLFSGPSLEAVFDWEIATVSDQRLDLGCLAVASLRRRYPDPNPTGGLSITVRELADRYGLPLPEARWFAAAACLKYAAILGYNLGLHRRGRREDPLYERLLTTMRALATDGLALLRGQDL